MTFQYNFFKTVKFVFPHHSGELCDEESVLLFKDFLPRFLRLRRNLLRLLPLR